MKISGYTLGPGLEVHTSLIDDEELDDVIEFIAEELQAFRSLGRDYTTITLEFADGE